MRTDIPQSLQDHLNTQQTTLAWCWKIELRNGTTLGFTNHDRDLTFDSVVYEASTGFLGSEIESQLGMTVDNMDVYGAVDSVNISETDIEAGRYDNADVTIYLVNWLDTSQRMIMKKGHVGNVKRSKTMFEAEVRGISHEMQQVRGRLYGYKCDALLGDSRCTKNISGSDFTATATILATDGASSITAGSIGSYANGWFSRGIATFGPGSGNEGVTREIKVHTRSEGSIVHITVWEPLPFTIQVGGSVTVVAGCDKTFKTCKAKFNNAINFRGFPHVPGHSTIQYYVNQGDPNLDGGGNFVGKD